MIKITMLPVGLLEANCYIVVRDDEHEDAVLIDPGADAARIERELDKARLSVKAVLLTHGHFDHCNAARYFQAKGAKVYLHEADEIMTRTRLNMSELTGEPFNAFTPDVLLTNGTEIDECGMTFRTLHTPGHTAGSVCYLLEDKLFTGDTLFCLGVGRTDLPTGDYRMLVSSVRDVLFKLSGDYSVFPGHGELTTLSYEKKHNMFAEI